MNGMMEMKKEMIKQKLMGLMSMMTMKGSSMGSHDGMKILMSSGMMGHGMGMLGSGCGGGCMPMSGCGGGGGGYGGGGGCMGMGD